MTLAESAQTALYLSLLLEDGTSRKHAKHAYKSLSDSYAFTIGCGAKLRWLQSVIWQHSSVEDCKYPLSEKHQAMYASSKQGCAAVDEASSAKTELHRLGLSSLSVRT